MLKLIICVCARIARTAGRAYSKQSSYYPWHRLGPLPFFSIENRGYCRWILNKLIDRFRFTTSEKD